MHYDIRRILCSTALSLVLGLFATQEVRAQGTVSLGNEMPVLDTQPSPEGNVADASIPDQIALPSEAPVSGDDNSGLIAPPSSTTMFDEEPEGVMAAPSNPAANAPSSYQPVRAAVINDEELGDGVLRQIDNDLFAQMSDIEKQTALLNLELRREKVKTEIEAIKAQRKKAQEQETALEEEKVRKKFEFEQDQLRKNMEEQRKLVEAQKSLEAVRQEKILKVYKENMLEENKKWIEANENFYRNLTEVEKERDSIIENFKIKLKDLGEVALKTKNEAALAKESYDREITALQSQISIFKARIEATEAAASDTKANPFASTGSGFGNSDVKLGDEYAIMEVRGQGEELIAKLMNREGKSFNVKKGTVLQSGHIVDEITQTYIRADKSGLKDYIYFSAGGVLEREPVPGEAEENLKSALGSAEASQGSNATPTKKEAGKKFITNSGVPSLNSGMFVK